MTCCPSFFLLLFAVVEILLDLVPVDGWCAKTTSRRIVTLSSETSTLAFTSTARQPFHLLAGKSSTNERSKARASTHKKQSFREKSWEAGYQRLVKFRNKYGHTNIPTLFDDGGGPPHLGSWVRTQRYQHRNNDPPYCKKRAEKLDSIGFVWIMNSNDFADKKWESMFQRLVKFQNKHGHTKVPTYFSDGEGQPRLGIWVATQRSQRKRNDPPYPSKRAEKLNSIGFVWTLDAEGRSQKNRDDETWNKTVHRLEEYKQQHGHVNVPRKYNDGQRPHLGPWVSHQRNYYREYQNPNYSVGLITKEHIEILESFGFEWNPGREDEYDKAWVSQFKAMKKFVKKYNTTKVSHSLLGYNSSIAITLNWAHRQRVSYNQFMRNETSIITPQQIDLLNSIDFAWNLTNKTSHEKWIHQYFKLYCHHFQHNNTVISQSSGYNSDFVYWVEMQKRDYNAGKLPQGKIDLLNDLNFDWTLHPVTTWEDLYEQLSQYHDRFGSTLINTKIDKDLGMWTGELRILYSKGDLDPTWVAKLNQLTFDWDAEDVNWNAMYDRLIAYKKKHGTACVPYVCPDDPTLSSWVQANRRAYKHIMTDGMDGISLQNQSAVLEVAQKKATKRFPASIHAARLLKLLEIEFVWSPFDVQWQEWYDRLVAYKKSNGHTLVPKERPEHPDLAEWVHKQRAASETMSEARKTALDAIGFVWDPLEARWQEMFHKYCDMQAKNVIGNKDKMDWNGKELYEWIRHQRQNYRRGGLNKARISMLESTGFDWKINNAMP
ncbi:helicase domain protein [Nitzschia inconspicua]|uniref:Helicase domain protein n=1 Tax=Nitzschia inconspicua TaxID=303405 RepID=A0A9K3KCN1_9STRA|nr:helicase domain protein [Nitzschia inconspicua]